MRKFATEYPYAFTQQVVAQLTNHLSISPDKQTVTQIDSYEVNTSYLWRKEGKNPNRLT